MAEKHDANGPAIGVRTSRFKARPELTGHEGGDEVLDQLVSLVEEILWKGESHDRVAGPETDRQIAYARMAPAERRSDLLRLRTLVAVEEGAIPIGVAASEAGMSRSAFHSMRRRWDRDRSIESVLSLKGGGGAPRLFERDVIIGHVLGRDVVDPRLSRMIEDISHGPPLSNYGWAKAILHQGYFEASVAALSALVGDIRRVLDTMPEALFRGFGSGLLVDASAAAMHVDTPSGRRTMVAAFVVERASGLVLAASAGTVGDALWRQFSAVEEAIGFVERCRLDRVGTRTTLTFVAAPAEDRDQAWALKYFEDYTLDTIITTGARRLGVELREVVGSSVGGLRLLPRASLSEGLVPLSPRETMTPLKLEDAEWSLRRAVETHNAKIFGILRKAGLANEPHAVAGTMTEALTEAAAAFRRQY